MKTRRLLWFLRSLLYLAGAVRAAVCLLLGRLFALAEVFNQGLLLREENELTV